MSLQENVLRRHWASSNVAASEVLIKRGNWFSHARVVLTRYVLGQMIVGRFHWRGFVSFLVHSLMIAVMLLHSILGCCWHHSHEDSNCGCVAVFCSTGTEQTSSHAECSHSGDHDCDGEHSGACPGDDSEGAPHRHDPCDHDECVYMIAKVVGAPLSFSVAFAVTLDAPCATGLITDIHRRVEIAEASPRRGSSMDSCALLQVWRV